VGSTFVCEFQGWIWILKMRRPKEWYVTRKGEEWKSIDGNGLKERNNFKPLAAIASGIFLSPYSFQCTPPH